MACFRLFSKTSGFNPTSNQQAGQVVARSNSQTGRYTKREEFPIGLFKSTLTDNHIPTTPRNGHAHIGSPPQRIPEKPPTLAKKSKAPKLPPLTMPQLSPAAELQSPTQLFKKCSIRPSVVVRPASNGNGNSNTPVYLEELKQKQKSQSTAPVDAEDDDIRLDVTMRHPSHTNEECSVLRPVTTTPTQPAGQTETAEIHFDAHAGRKAKGRKVKKKQDVGTSTAPNVAIGLRDSGVHSDEQSGPRVSREDGDEHDGQEQVQADEADATAELKTRKEGLIFDRPKLSKEGEQVITVHVKDEKTRKLIRTAIERNDFLNNYMDAERKERVIDAMEPAYYEKGSYIIREDEEGSEIYVSEEGFYDVLKKDEIINTLGAGIVFGELAILYNAKRFASIKAATKVKVWKIDRSKFRAIMLISGSKEKEENLLFLKSAPLLKDLPEEVLLKLVELLKRIFFPTNTCIVRQGDVGNDFFIIRGGTVSIKKTNEYGLERVVDRRKRGEYFGEQALLNADRRQASVYADAPGTECLKLDRESFISYLGTIPEMKHKPIDKQMIPEVKRPSDLQTQYEHIELSDLTRIATLGAGAFGRVDLVQHTDGQTFALKVIKKIDVIKQDQVDHVYSEKQVMFVCHNCPFIIELCRTFRDRKYVYFLMEACLGGDVWTIMYQRKFFDEKSARFIAGCVVEAFDFLHSRHIIYRDLKPENLMLTPDGYCKLVDFGFAKRVSPNHKTNTFAGTPEYVAPEIILDRGHDRSVDYWALGILIFELLVGKTPFRGQNQMKIYQQILGGIDAVKMPPRIPKTAQGLIRNLCKQMPAERLGYQRKGIADIKKHSWFDALDWEKLENKALVSPVKRPVTSNTDLQHFTPCAETTDVPPDETSGWDSSF